MPLATAGFVRFADDAVAVVPVRAFRGALGAKAPFSSQDKAEIARSWRAALAEKPEMFDGRVLLGCEAGVEDGVLSARYAEVAFSAFHWWRATAGARGMRNVFGAAAVVAVDGGVLLGRMAPHTAAAGQIYFPCGTPDLGDVRDGVVDLDYSISRELMEETGLAGEAAPSPEAFAVVSPKVAAFVRRYDSGLTRDELLRRIQASLAAEDKAELDGVTFARSADDLSGASPAYVHLVLPHLLAGSSGA